MLKLRVLWGDEPELSPQDSQKAALIAARPELAWRMREFFENWFAKRYLKKCCDETTRNYRSSLRYWEAITDDWRLVDFASDRDGADEQCLDFTEQLSEWGYSRRGVRRGEPIRIGRLTDNPSFTALGAITAREHADRMANLFRKAGPERDNRRHYAELLPRAPRIELMAADFEEKSPFSHDEARAIAAAASRMVRPALPDWLPCELWWQTRLALLYYTGLRMGTIVRLSWSHVSALGTSSWLSVPKELIKTGKKIDMPLHPQLAALLLAVRDRRPKDDTEELLIPNGCTRRTFLDHHAELQARAALPEESRQSPHAWRRTHLTRIYELGAGRGLEAAQAAADHADGRTTAQHYVATVVNHFRLRLPPLFA